MKAVGWKFDQWWDVVFLQLSLGLGSSTSGTLKKVNETVVIASKL